MDSFSYDPKTQLAARYKLYASVEEMLAPQTLSDILQASVKNVSWHAYRGEVGFSTSRFLTIETGEESGSRYILKRMNMATDWTMQASEDELCRSVTIWQYGLLDQLDPIIEHAIVGCSQDEGGWAILMRDVSTGLFRGRHIFSPQVIYHLLDSLAAIHATFWQAPILRDPALGLCDSAGLLKMYSPMMVPQLAGITTKHPQMLDEGWAILQENIAPDVAEILAQLLVEPQPLLLALASQPWTLLHGNPHPMNLGILPNEPPRPIFLDWQTAGYSSPILDLAWLLEKDAVEKSSLSKEQAVAFYYQKLVERLGDRFDLSLWPSMLELGWLAHVLRWGSLYAWLSFQDKDERQVAFRQAGLEAINEQVRVGAKWLAT